MEVQTMMSVLLSQQPPLAQSERQSPSSLPPAISRIAVPLDGSQLAERVLALAVALARAFHAELLLVRAYGGPGRFPLGSAGRIGVRAPAAGNARMTEASLHLARLATELRNCGVRVATRLMLQQADEAILEVAAHAPADLILLAAEPHMRGGHASALGHVADRVVRESRIPVLLTTSRKGAQALAVERMPPRVLVPLDPTTAGARTLPYARAFAEAFHGSITLVGRSEASLARASVATGSKLPDRGAVPPGPWETRLLTAETADEFVAGISSLAGDLIVWGRSETATLDGDARWIRGAAQLLCHGYCPVLMVP
jgi:nucleotide-binding universal stress UspA family protein